MKPATHILTDATPALHYLAYNDEAAASGRPALIFLHGVTSHAHYWDSLAPYFTDAYAVYSLDWRGHGDSGQTEAYDRIEDYVSDLKRLMAALDPTEVALVGHSMGGYAALVYATEGDPRLKKIVVADVKIDLTPQEREAFERAAAKAAPRFATQDELANRFIGTLRDSTADKSLLAEIGRLGSRQNEDGTFSHKYDRAVMRFPRPEPFRYAPNVKIPALVVNGAQSEMVPGPDAAKLAAAIPNAQHVEIPGAGHHCFLDRSAEFSRVVREFLERG